MSSNSGQNDFIGGLLAGRNPESNVGLSAPDNPMNTQEDPEVVNGDLLGRFFSDEYLASLNNEVAEISRATRLLVEESPYANADKLPAVIGSTGRYQALVAKDISDSKLTMTAFNHAKECAEAAEELSELILGRAKKSFDFDLSFYQEDEDGVAKTVVSDKAEEDLAVIEEVASSYFTPADITLVKDLQTKRDRSLSQAQSIRDRLGGGLGTNKLYGRLKKINKIGNIDKKHINSLLNLSKNTFRAFDASHNVIQASLKLAVSRRTVGVLSELKRIEGVIETDPRVAENFTEAETQDLRAFLDGILREVETAWENYPDLYLKIKNEIYGEPKNTDTSTVVEEQEDPSVEILRRKINIARNIHIGGGRLKVGREKMTTKAESLAKISEEFGIRGLLTYENGMMVSILSGDFSTFDEVVTLLQESEDDPTLKEVEKDITRRQIHQDLRNVDIVQSSKKILNVLDDERYGEALISIFGLNQMGIIKSALERRINIDNEEDAVTSSSENANFMELDWEPLPPGEELKKFAEEIVELVQSRLAKGSKVEIDLSRLGILHQVKESWDKGNSGYAKGRLKKRGMISRDGKSCPDEYIVLWLEEQLPNGSVLTHAIAESPIVGPHATYVHREDTYGFDWKDIFSLPKSDAREFGARSIRHESLDGEDIIDGMVRKVSELLTCDPQEFSRYRFRRPQTPGQYALDMTTEIN